MGTKSEEQKIEEMMPLISLWVIGVATALGLALSIGIDSRVPSFNKVLIAAAFLFIAIADLLIARFINLPGLTRAGSPRTNLVTIGYAQSMLPAPLAFLVGILVDQWWLALVFGGVGMACWFMVRDYLGPPPARTSQAR
ncbi:MAG TPA: hypothetical protein VLS25_00415 [Dehalococcoidia bacterium]|nr:hypothetical protein [Dehalococcoidia bacterium]